MSCDDYQVTVYAARKDDSDVDVPNEELEAVVDVEIAKFDDAFQKDLGNAPLTKSERAVLKTYLYWKTHSEKFNASQASSST